MECWVYAAHSMQQPRFVLLANFTTVRALFPLTPYEAAEQKNDIHIIYIEMRPRIHIQDGAMLDTPVTFVTSEIQGNVHIFIPETFHRNLVEVIASNFRYKNSYFLLRFSILNKTAGECSSQYLCSMTPIDRSFESARFPQGLLLTRPITEYYFSHVVSSHEV